MAKHKIKVTDFYQLINAITSENNLVWCLKQEEGCMHTELTSPDAP